MSTKCLAMLMNGKVKPGLQLCRDAVSLAQASGDQRLITATKLSKAIASYVSGDMDSAFSEAYELTTKYSSDPNGQNAEIALEASWIAAIAGFRKEEARAIEQFNLSRSISDKLQQSWGAETYRRYLNRKDIKFLTDELDKYKPGETG